MANMPSGPGPNDKAHSLSVTIATDQGAIPVEITGADVQVDIDSSNLATHDDALEISGKLGSTAAAAAADAEATATTMGTLRARLMAWNGAAWDRVRSGLTAITSTFTGFLNSIPFAIFNTTPTVRTTGQGGPLEADANGNLRIAEQAPPAYENVSDASASVHDKPAASAAYNAIAYDNITKANAGVIKASAGNLYRLYVTNDNAAAQYYALINKATTPANGDAPLMYFKVAAGETKLIEFKFGKRFTTGIGWAQVTAITATITLAGTTDTVANAEVG